MQLAPEPMRRTLRTAARLAFVVAAGLLLGATTAAARSSTPLLQNGSAGQFKPRTFCPANHSCFTSAVRYTRARWRYPGLHYPTSGWVSSVFNAFSRGESGCGWWSGA